MGWFSGMEKAQASQRPETGLKKKNSPWSLVRSKRLRFLDAASTAGPRIEKLARI